MIGAILIGGVLGFMVRFIVEILKRNKPQKKINDIEVKDYTEVK